MEKGEKLQLTLPSRSGKVLEGQSRGRGLGPMGLRELTRETGAIRRQGQGPHCAVQQREIKKMKIDEAQADFQH